MKIDLRQIFSIAGESRNFRACIDMDVLDSIKGWSFTAPVRLSGRVSNRAGVVTLDYTAEFSLNVLCDRCLKKSVRDSVMHFSHTVIPAEAVGDSDDDDYYVRAEGQSIELNDVAVTDILLELPSKNLCREDCKGLCPVCGCDLNEGPCDCPK